jgi:hypothetical protein
VALQAQQICTLARQVAKGPGFTLQSGELLNSILADLCQKYDLDLAKKTLNFNLTPAAAHIGNLNAQLASGPFILPADYLRTKIGDVLYFPNGLGNFPLRLTPIDLGEFDGLVQQAGFQNFPVFWVTDMSQTPPIAYVWPPASGAYPLMVRYASQMPDITAPETSTAVPWFPNQEYLRKKLAASLMELSGDQRKPAWDAEAEDVLRGYLRMKDDSSNRSQRVKLDGRRFGSDWSRLPKSKVYGY